ncbi:MAG: hypothetical protein H0T42_28850 [Deltaproteobacteria bacterium]|nr:hypothetical protein [Deltaproteobacteria bacterium]
MSRNLHPTEGARFLLERTTEQDTRATYRASVYTRDSVFTAVATVDEDGTAELGPTGAPGDLDERMRTIAKLLARDATRRRDDGLVVWPVRILRWRK